jgi:hypothetical protein
MVERGAFRGERRSLKVLGAPAVYESDVRSGEPERTSRHMKLVDYQTGTCQGEQSRNGRIS